MKKADLQKFLSPDQVVTLSKGRTLKNVARLNNWNKNKYNN